MNDLEVLRIDGVKCYEKDGVAYLRLEDVAKGLGFVQNQVKNGSEYTAVRWERVERYLSDFGFPHKWGKDDFIPESIFYRLAMKAKNDVAERFQAKVAEEIIPSIRKHGAYATTETLDKLIASPDFGIRLLTELKNERDKREALEAQAELDRPKVVFADAVSVAENCILVGELAKILKQNGIEMGQNRLFRWMRDNGYLIKRQGTDFNMPTQRAMELGLFSIKETSISHSDGHVTVTKTPKVSGKGQAFFINQFLGKKKGRGAMAQPRLLESGTGATQ